MIARQPTLRQRRPGACGRRAGRDRDPDRGRVRWFQFSATPPSVRLVAPLASAHHRVTASRARPSRRRAGIPVRRPAVTRRPALDRPRRVAVAVAENWNENVLPSSVAQMLDVLAAELGDGPTSPVPRDPGQMPDGVAPSPLLPGATPRDLPPQRVRHRLAGTGGAGAQTQPAEAGEQLGDRAGAPPERIEDEEQGVPEVEARDGRQRRERLGVRGIDVGTIVAREIDGPGHGELRWARPVEPAAGRPGEDGATLRRGSDSRRGRRCHAHRSVA